MEHWILQEFDSLKIGDVRLDLRVKKILSTLSHSPQESIPVSCKGWGDTKAAYRCFSNKKVTADKILAPHKQATIKRVKDFNRVLILQDTTELDYSGQKEKQGVGPTKHGTERALLLHPQLVVSESGVCLGVYDDYQWSRSELKAKKYERKKLKNDLLHKKHVSEKESWRWVNGYRIATDLAKRCSGTHVISISDREGDLYDLYQEARNTEGIKADWLVRIKFINRATINNQGKRDFYALSEKMLSIKPHQIIEFTFHDPKAHMSRKVVQELKLARLILHPPTGRRGNLRCSPVEVTVLLAKEIDPPENVKPLTWWLMSSVPLNILKDPAQLISWYLKRWQIEIFFKILKSGCQVEKLQLETSERTRSCIALYLIIAWRILFISSQFKNTPEFTCEVILEKKEWQVLWLLVQGKNIPDEPPHVQTAILMIAKLGGYLARKNDSSPGPKAIWRGLTQLYHAITAIELAETTYG